MKSELEALLKAFDAFRQAPRSEAQKYWDLYSIALEEEAQKLRLSSDVLDRLVRRKHPRWVRANLPAKFPRELGF
jgi:hypothetical protein